MFSRFKNNLKNLLIFPIALVLIFEEWGWLPLSSFFSRLAQTFEGWRKLEIFLTKLSPTFSLFILLIPILTLLPLKFLGFFFLESGNFIVGVLIIVVSKVLGTAFFARLFTLVRPNLMKLVWFSRFYPQWVLWKDSLLHSLRSSWPWQLIKRAKLKLLGQ